MAETENRRLHSVAPLSDEAKRKIRNHRIKNASIFAAVIILIAVAIFVAYYIITHKEYKDLEILEVNTHEENKSASYQNFAGNILKLTNDGASYSKQDGTLIWNQTFEMNDPKASVCGNYVVLYEVNNNKVYVLDTVNLCGNIVTTAPVKRATVGSQGTVALLMETEGVNYLQLYDSKGTMLAAGEIHSKNSGYPMDIALSPNGEKLAVSMLDISTGDANSNIVFYNFGNVGQNEIDKIVGTFTYEKTIIPQLEYMENDTLVAFADDRVILFSGTQKPAESVQIELDSQIASTFFNSKNIGLVLENDDSGYTFKVYDTQAKEVTSGEIDFDYDRCEFLGNGDISIYNSEDIVIQTITGVRRLESKIDRPIVKVFSDNFPIVYKFLLEDEIRKCRCK